MKIKVAIVEDSEKCRASVAKLLGDSNDLSCVAAVTDAEAALAELPQLKPDVILMDIELPGISGVECVGRLKELLPETQIMMLTFSDEPDKVFDSLRAGATGYLLKEFYVEELVESIRALHSGGSPMSNSIARKVVVTFQKPAKLPGAELTQREEEILNRLGRGHRFKEIAEELGVSFHTVRTHVQNIYKKLHVRSKGEALEHARARRR